MSTAHEIGIDVLAWLRRDILTGDNERDAKWLRDNFRGVRLTIKDWREVVDRAWRESK